MSLNIVQKLCSSPSAAERQGLAELYDRADDPTRMTYLIAMLDADYKDAVEFATFEAESATFKAEAQWHQKLIDTFADVDATQKLKQNVIWLIGDLMPDFADVFDATISLALESKDADIRYQGLVAREKIQRTDREYIDKLVTLLQDGDSDIRILASQGLSRIGDAEASLEALQEASRYAFGIERVEHLFSRAMLGEEGLVPELIKLLGIDRYCFVAAKTLGKLGDPEACDALMRVAKGWFVDPTVRVEAAWAAAKCGCDEATELLESLARKKRGNPAYAKEALASLYGDGERS